MLTKERPSTSFDTESYRSSASRPKPKSSDTGSPQYQRRPNKRQFLARGKTSSRRAQEERRCKTLQFFSTSCWPLGRGFYPRIEPDFHLLVQLFWLPRRLSLCFPASLETYRRKHQGLALLRSVGKRQDLAGLALKKLSYAAPACRFSALTGCGCLICSSFLKNFASGCARSDANAVGRPVVSRLRRPYVSPGRSPKSAFARDPRPSSRRPVS